MRSTQDVVRFLVETSRRIDSGELPRGHAPFVVAYHAFTLQMLGKLSSGAFADPVRMSELIVRYGASYARAIAAGASGPAPWRRVFAVAEASPRHVLRNLLLAASAHASYDLSSVIAEMLVDHRPGDLAPDLFAINDVVEGGITPVQRAIAVRSRYAGLLATLGGGIDVLATSRTFKHWRDRAWEDALAIRRGAITLADVEARVARRGDWLARIPL